jgi:hypothetical protein
MKFLVFDEDWIVDGSILYDSPIDPIEADSVEDLIKKVKNERLITGVVQAQKIDENELMVEFLIPFDLTHEYHFIEEEEAKKRRLDNSLSEPE